MGYTAAEAQIVTSLAFAFVVWLYFRHAERQHRLEIVHKERLAAMEKGIPLPELPLDPPKTRKPADPRAPLMHGIVWTAIGAGASIAMRFIPQGTMFWPLGMPLMLLGIGLILFYVIASNRNR